MNSVIDTNQWAPVQSIPFHKLSLFYDLIMEHCYFMKKYTFCAFSEVFLGSTNS